LVSDSPTRRTLSQSSFPDVLIEGFISREGLPACGRGESAVQRTSLLLGLPLLTLVPPHSDFHRPSDRSTLIIALDGCQASAEVAEVDTVRTCVRLGAAAVGRIPMFLRTPDYLQQFGDRFDY
jgi:hypothetical protein